VEDDLLGKYGDEYSSPAGSLSIEGEEFVKEIKTTNNPSITAFNLDDELRRNLII